jgi:VanZ family protein
MYQPRRSIRPVSTFNGLPAHVLFVHFIVVLAPLTAVLAILCAVWPAARQRLVWLVLALSLVVAVLTPLTTEAGEWLEDRIGKSPAVDTHAELGDTMIYFALALLIAAVLTAVVHVSAARGRSVPTVLTAVVAVFVVVAGVATIVQVYRIGDSGAKATWSGIA